MHDARGGKAAPDARQVKRNDASFAGLGPWTCTRVRGPFQLASPSSPPRGWLSLLHQLAAGPAPGLAQGLS